MKVSQARSISTNQTHVHEELNKILARHKLNDFQRPIAHHTEAAFNGMLAWLGGFSGDLILDAGCGVGESTINIAAQYPNAKVIGVDKSIVRLDKHKSYALQRSAQKNKTSSGSTHSVDPNYLLLQADLNDFWRLLATYIQENKPIWQVSKQFILYPNPYPKKSQIGKRWHGSALFPVIVNVSANIELRSNWRLYLEECLLGAKYYGLGGNISEISIDSSTLAYTPFERKYIESNQACFKLVIRAPRRDRK
jgi:tRNA G46 methylase TrmB